MTTYISTATGGTFDYINPTPEMVQVEDIAHALSHLCRFSGHCAHFYSVAEHSVHASYLVEPSLALEALLHDATEAYCVDIPRPLKRLLPEYQAMEDRVWQVIARRFDLPAVMSPAVKLADTALLKYEIMRIMPIADLDALAIPGAPADVRLHLWEPTAGRAHFLHRYQELVR